MKSATTKPLPFEKLYELDRLGKAGAVVSVKLKESEREKLAHFLDIDAVEFFNADVHLIRHSRTHFSLDANFTAEVVQPCVVTLEPVHSKIERAFKRDLYIASPVRRLLSDETEAPKASIEDDVTEEIDGPDFDLARPLIEELSLAIDPYPRAPGVAFEQPRDGTSEDEGPFAALKALKNKDKP